MLYDQKELAALLGEVKTVAVVGAVDKPGRPVDTIGRYLIAEGYDVVPVHPKRTGVWGLKTFRSLGDIDRPVELVNLFRNADFCPQHALETLELAPLPRCFWMQSGIISPAARELLAPKDILVIEDKCIMVEHRRLLK